MAAAAWRSGEPEQEQEQDAFLFWAAWPCRQVLHWGLWLCTGMVFLPGACLSPRPWADRRVPSLLAVSRLQQQQQGCSPLLLTLHLTRRSVCCTTTQHPTVTAQEVSGS